MTRSYDFKIWEVIALRSLSQRTFSSIQLRVLIGAPIPLSTGLRSRRARLSIDGWSGDLLALMYILGYWDHAGQHTTDSPLRDFSFC